MTIVQDNSTNFGAIIVPDVLVNIIPPSIALLNGVPTNIAAYVGAASWGPVNRFVKMGSYAQYVQTFGALMARVYDMGTHLALGVLQGAASFACVRVTDGTDVAASGSLTIAGATPLLFTGKYTGIRGNAIKVTFAPGSALNSWRVVVAVPGQQPEVFDNIKGAGAALWANVVLAINAGANQLRGAPSNLVVASAPDALATVPVAGAVTTVALSGGTDGDTGLTPAMLLGNDGSPRTGMYALRNSGAAVATVCDYTVLNNFSTIAAFGLSEGIYFIQAGAPGTCFAGNVGGVTADAATIAVDNYALKVLAGDWHYWNDPVTQQLRLVAPTAALIGLLVNLSPEQSALNKPLFGIAGTQTTAMGGEYSTAELTVIAQARYDIITLPSVGGEYYSSRIGINTSSNTGTHGDNYSRLTPYVARTFNAALGKWVGNLQTVSQRRNAKAQADAFFQNMQDLGQIGNAEGTTPFQVILDISNNPASRVALGYETATANVQYLSVIEKFILNLQGGQSVQIVAAAAQRPAAVG